MRTVTRTCHCEILHAIEDVRRTLLVAERERNRLKRPRTYRDGTSTEQRLRHPCDESDQRIWYLHKA